MNEMESLVRLNLSGMVGSSLLRRLREQFELERIPQLSRRELERVEGIGPLTSKAIAEAGDPRLEIELAARHSIEILPCTGAGFPPALRSLYDHPIVLYRRGSLIETDTLAVGVVGSRECTDYGRRQAARFGQELARLRITVVSGLARGIDTEAHRGALRAPEGRTIAVLGSGLLRVYPPENERLLNEICRRGAAYSEFPLESGPAAANFPRRNRIISGLSLGVLVVEAAERSGALLTADWALEQGRDVFCIPGSIENPMSRGCHRLIKQGAKLVEEPADLLEEIPAFATLVEPAVALTPLERAVLRQLSDRPSSPESIAAITRLPAPSVEKALMELTAKGVALQEGPGLFRRDQETATRRERYSSSRARSATMQ
jgi:DNA processing protein